ncbi:PREDICTED: uncharacterized protein LOC108976117 [Bactrocera latifrons]|uniref:uncharacterized protein LOC108976117 n=1 Tax=Bactrocera latifrons TaxID=174628 RepID=UPI0008DD7E1A|nr:PREDICTED: uncharacterized protein LOC108976117 [Bactrocera latifrons]
MRMLFMFSFSLVMAYASPLLKSKELYRKVKNHMFGVNMDCGHCGGIHTVQPMGMAPMPNVYAEAYNPTIQLHGESAAVSSASNVYNSQEYAPAHMNHFLNANGGRTHHFRSDERPAPALNYANNHYAQVENAAAASTAIDHSSSTLWQHEENAQAASRAQQLTVHGGGAVPPVPASPVWIEGGQYNAYSPLGAAAAAQSASSAWSQQNGNYGQNNGHGVAFAHASSTSWSSNNSG